MLAIGLDCFEISIAERLMEQGLLPNLAARGQQDAHLLLDPGADQRTGLQWEQFWSGLSPGAAGRESAVEFDPATYAVWQEGARFAPFFPPDLDAVVFDAPYVDLAQAPGVQGVVAWGAHDPGLPVPASRPRNLLYELERRVGPYPADRWVYATPWASAEDTRQMGLDLVAGVEARARGAEWLFAERFADWDLAVVVVSEPHSGAEGLWHGVDPEHPLYDAPSGRAAGEALTAVYCAVDRLVGDLVEATDPSSVVVFAMGGMGPNRSDAASMAVLPELMLRWALDEHRMVLPHELTNHPERVPVGDEEHMSWSRSWFEGVGPEPELGSRLPLRQLTSWLPESTRRRLQRARTGWRVRGQPLGYRLLDWMPATWYADRWPEMQAFVLPSFYDGRIRVNLRGREAAGMVDVADYERVCDEVEQLVRDCIDPCTGAGVVETVTRPGRGDPLSLGNSLADVVIEWAGCPLALTHPSYGTIGPLPYRRTGGHTSPYGFASLTGPGVAAGNYGIASALDLAPTVFELVTGRRGVGISGQSLAATLTGASTVAR
jgi:predicted AlkP superfamily phosphohydrolase/phosphomutase